MINTMFAFKKWSFNIFYIFFIFKNEEIMVKNLEQHHFHFMNTFSLGFYFSKNSKIFH
jgi:hypothetical protein